MTIKKSIQKLIKNEKKLNEYVLLFTSLFFSIELMSRVFTGGAEFSIILFTISVITTVYFGLIHLLMKLYKKIANILLFLFATRKLNFSSISIPLSWAPSAFICGICSIIITVVSLFLVQIYIEAPLNTEIHDYFYVVDTLVSFTIVPLTILFILSGLVTQIIVFKKIEKLGMCTATVTSIILVVVFTFIFLLLRKFIWGVIIIL